MKKIYYFCIGVAIIMSLNLANQKIVSGASISVKKNVSVKVGDKKNIVVRNAKKKVKWEIRKGKKQIKIQKKYGKNKSKALIIAKKKGRAVIIVKSAKKTKKINVTVLSKTIVDDSSKDNNSLIVKKEDEKETISTVTGLETTIERENSVVNDTTTDIEETTSLVTDTTTSKEESTSMVVDTEINETETSTTLDEYIDVTLDYGDVREKQVVQLKKGDTVRSIPIPIFEDYVFRAWRTEYIIGRVVSNYEVLEENTTLYAWLLPLHGSKYIPPWDYVKVTFDFGDLSPRFSLGQIVKGTYWKELLSFGQVGGHTINYWTTEPNGGDIILLDDIVTEDTTVYASFDIEQE